MRVLDHILAWTIIVLALIHTGFAFVVYTAFDIDTLWFLAAGAAMAACGIFNLLRLRYATAVPALRGFALGASLVLLALSLGAAYALRDALASNPQIFVLNAAALGEAFLSLRAR